jgi:galactonate dehydratase
VPLYANLNRGLTDRSPASFAAQAAAAAAAGFARIKVAPVDGVTPDSADGQANEARLRAGLDRIAALREALAPGVSLMVDCHWRLTPERAGRLVGDLAALGVSWLECPLPETPANFAAIAGLRRAATAAGMVLAGAELEIGVAGFLPFLDLYDVVMPDVKYCGGPAELLRIADAARARGCRIAPHNPSGPIAHAHSVHLAAHPAVDLLEHQFGESGLFGTLTTGGPPPIAAGTARSGDAPGLGAALDPARCAANPQRPIVSLD